MRKKRPHYAPEFRRQMVELVRAGRSPAELENEFEPTAQTIRKWVAQGDRDEGRRSDGLTTPEREELNRLRRENRQLKVEREILSKAAAWFARETNAIPSKSRFRGPFRATGSLSLVGATHSKFGLLMESDTNSRAKAAFWGAIGALMMLAAIYAAFE